MLGYQFIRNKDRQASLWEKGQLDANTPNKILANNPALYTTRENMVYFRKLILIQH